MTVISKVWRVARVLVISTFVVVHLLALALLNLKPLFQKFPDDLRVPHSTAMDYGHATGTHQRWNMFSPNVGNAASTPVVVVTLSDHSQRLVFPLTESGLPHDVPLLKLKDVPVDWVYHIGDGRIRKLESRIINPDPGYFSLRMRYLKLALDEFKQRHPDLAPKVTYARLAAVSIRYVGAHPRPVVDHISFVDTIPFNHPAWQPPVPVPPQKIQDKPK
jgi:hypothetical protein